MRRLPTLVALAAASLFTLLTTAPPAPAQEGNLQVPGGWEFRLDDPDPDVELVAHEDPASGEIRFVTMEPGWHVTTGPRVILYRPEDQARGDYRTEATFHLFDPGRRNEAYGLFVGGRDLQSADQRYLYFLIRRSGEFLVKVRDGAETRVVTDWTAHDAIVPFTDDTEDTATNTLAVGRTGDTLHFYVNGAEVSSHPVGELPVDGVVGWRINHALNLHVSGYALEAGG